jgi:hypothetical protein
MVLTAYIVLSPVIGLFVTVACASSRRLDAGVEASGPHDFAVRARLSKKPLDGLGTSPPKL